jgi:hypothetical protein
MGKTTIFYLPSLTIQNRGAGGPWPTGGGAAPAGGPVHDDDREVGQNEEEFEGNRFHLLPWAGVLWRGGLMAGGGAARGGGRGGTGGGDGGLGEREKWSWRCGVPRRAAQGLL